MDKSMKSRIAAMARRDRLTAVIFTVCMWVALLFTYFAVSTVVPTAGVSVALFLALVVLGAFNTASMIAMVRCYAKDESFIYREDIVNLDKNRKRKGGR